MLLKHLISPKPSILIFFIIFCVVFALIPIFSFEIDAVYNHYYLHNVIVLILALVMPFFLSTGLNNIIYDKNIIRKENLVIGFVFILISGPFTNTVEAWISSFLLLFMFNFLLESYQKDLPFSQFYNASFLLAVITFIYPNIIFLISLLLIGGVNYSNLNWRILFTIILGFITPYVFYFIFIFLTEVQLAFPNFFSLSQISFSQINKLHPSKLFWLLILILIIIFSFFELYIWLYKKSIKSRRTFMTIIWFFLISILIAIFSGWQYFYFSLIPCSILISNYFVYTKKRKIANILFLLLVISSAFYKYVILY